MFSGALEAGEGRAGLDGLSKLVDPLRSVSAPSILNATERIVLQAAGCKKSASVHWAMNKKKRVQAWAGDAHLRLVREQLGSTAAIASHPWTPILFFPMLKVQEKCKMSQGRAWEGNEGKCAFVH